MTRITIIILSAVLFCFLELNSQTKTDSIINTHNFNLIEPKTDKNLPFGHDFFMNKQNFTPSQTVQVPPDYIIAPGDEIIITLWGRISERWQLTVMRDGTVYIPKIGVLNVSGLKFSNLLDFFKKEISKYYTDFEISVSMGVIKSIRVYVVGNVKKPGSYVLPGISTVINALFEAEGPTINGSYRKIYLKREGETISEIDLYDLLIKGDKKSDLRLINDDIVYVPPVGKTVTILNGVKVPSRYELKDGEKLYDLIELAGGFTNTSYSKKIKIKRIFEGKYYDFYENDITELTKTSSSNIELNDGDIIELNEITDFLAPAEISGAVFFPQKIGLKQGKMKIADIINLAGGLLPSASNKAEITRFLKESDGIKTYRFEIEIDKALSNDPLHNIEIFPYDNIVVKTLPDWYYPKKVKISGEVNSPGIYTIEKGEKLSSLLRRVDGFTKNANPSGIIFMRKEVKQQQEKNLNEIIEKLEKEIFLSSQKEMEESLSQEKVSAKKASLEIKQKFLEKLKKIKPIGRIYIKLETIENLEKTPYDIELQEGDEIIIPQKSDVVNVVGAVMMEGSFVFTTTNYKKYIELAGGFSRYADKSNIIILRADGSSQKISGKIIKPKIKPGDTIFVPEKLETVAWMREIRDITQIIANIAMTTGIIIKIF